MENKDIETAIIVAPKPSEQTKKSAMDLEKYIRSLDLSKKQEKKLHDKIKRFVACARTDIIVTKFKEIDIDNDVYSSQLN